jgi:hypothetical protein
MLIIAMELSQQEDFNDLYTRFPSVRGWLDTPLRLSVARRSDELDSSEGFSKDIANQAFGDALQYALLLAKNRNPTKFARLACETFGLGDCPIKDAAWLEQSNLFVEGALYEIFTWDPKPWIVPTDHELTKLEALICQPGDTDDRLPATDDGVFY